MDVKLISWAYKDIRGGLSGVEVKLGSPPNRWTLIQMPNGMGKTTTMHLFRSAFSGEQMDADVVRGFRPSDKIATGEFELVISVGDQTCRITISMNYDAGTMTYHTARAETQAGGKQSGHILPKDLKSLLTREFTKLFIFDGELARQIRDIDSQKAVEAIRALYNLDRLGEMRACIERLIAEEQQKSSTTKAHTSQGLKGLRTRVETAKAQLIELRRRERILRKFLTDGRDRLQELDKSISEHMQQDDSFRKKVVDLESKKNSVEIKLVSIAKSTLAELRNPATIHARLMSELSELGQKMQSLKLPKTMSIEFFHELANQTTCVCGRSIGALERDAILTRADEYLSEDQIGVVNAIKSAVRLFQERDTTFSERAKELNALIEQRQRLNGDWDRLESDRVAAGDFELEQLKSEKTDLQVEIDEHHEKLIALTCTEEALQRDHGVDEKSNIPLCNVQVKEREKALAEATGTVEFVKKASGTKDLIAQIETSALDLIKERLKNSTNDKLKTFLRNEAIRIVRIGGALELESDQIGSKQQVSEGQSLAIAYAFLTSLFEQAPYRLPFIVDSPAGSLDLEVRREVAELIPNLFDQMVMFVISSEREAFAEPFYDRKGVRFCTIWRDASHRTKVNDTLEFFKQFHSEER